MGLDGDVWEVYDKGYGKRLENTIYLNWQQPPFGYGIFSRLPSQPNGGFCLLNNINMAQRRMFSQEIVESDAFLEMPLSTQCLYFHLGMYADDDGFVNPKKIMRLLGSQTDDLKVLTGKRFVLPFQSGVVVVKHWRMNNFLRKDRYKPTAYLEERNQIYLKENNSYTEDKNQGTPVKDIERLSVGQPMVDAEKSSIDKYSKEEEYLCSQLKDWNERQSSPLPAFKPENIVRKYGVEKVGALLKRYGEQNNGFSRFLSSLTEK
ncbi:MAG: hypothetical protein NUV80_00895 [Candidatus Berkelbacteria bacterium]|nr:hypothetical protein [Candidatus Berkelbacteria bacterium]